ncbi:MAG TPA: flagellar biosynthesis protein FlhB [Burkholderiaceae bacterium]|nr:flagellar biosynthesis protein FlhB [Burkholderiaceae bacterium]
MAEESGQERTIEPSAKRLADARSKGNVARSRYLSHGLMLGAAAALLFALGASLRDAATQWLVHGLTFDAAAAANPAAMGDRLMRAVMAAMTSLVPVFAVLCVAAAIGPVAMGGLMFNLDVVAPDAERLNPMTGFGRLFSANGMIELGKAIVVVAVLGSVAVSLVRSRIERFAALASSSSLPAALGEAGDLLLTAIAAMVGVVALLAAIEAPLQWWRYRKQLMMTPEEAKREAKDAEGDPRIKGRIRNAMRAMARKRMMAAVPKADVVVTNPQHFAVALKYLEQRHVAPVVVAKGHDAVAETIKALAREHGVPRLEAPPLARALYRHAEINEPIPAALYTAVAQVLAYVHQLRRYAAGAGPRPVEPRDIEVPDGMDPLQPRATA